MRTKTTPAQTAIHATTMIPLRNLVHHPRNVRRTDNAPDIERLAATIQHHGLLHNLVVEPLSDKPIDRTEHTPANEQLYGVAGGGRRLRALRKLAEREQIDWTQGIPCVVIDDPARAEEFSLTENANRVALNPVDACEAYNRLVAEGAAVADISRRFGVTERHVKQRLKLASLAPEVKDAGRNGELSTAVLEAFTTGADHDAQRNLLARITGDTGWRPTPEYIRSELRPNVLTADSLLVRTIGLQAYTQAGGRVEHDLFAEYDNGKGVFISDPEIAERVLTRQLNAAAEEVRREDPPWKWVEVVRTLAPNTLLDFGKTGTQAPIPPDIQAKIEALDNEITGLSRELDTLEGESDEDLKTREKMTTRYRQCEDRITEMLHAHRNRRLYTATEKAVSGCIVHFDYAGISITRGLVRAEDAGAATAAAEKTSSRRKPKPAEGGTTTPTAEDPSGTPDPADPISAETSVSFQPPAGGRYRDHTQRAGVDPAKSVLKANGLSSPHAERLRGHRMAIIRAHADKDPQLLCDLISFHHWTQRPDSPSSSALLIDRLETGSRPTTSPAEESAAGKAAAIAAKMDSGLNLNWLSGTDAAKRFKALRALPLRERRLIFAAAVCSWMRPQLSIDLDADLGLEAAVDELNIDWSRECRPDREYWRRTPISWTRELLKRKFSEKFAADAVKGRKSDAADRLETIFSDNEKQPVPVTPEERTRMLEWKWAVPGMEPRTDPYDPRIRVEPMDTSTDSDTAPGETPSDAEDPPPGEPPSRAGDPPPGKTASRAGGPPPSETPSRAEAPQTEPQAKTDPASVDSNTAETAGADDAAETFDRTEASELPAFLRPTTPTPTG